MVEAGRDRLEKNNLCRDNDDDNGERPQHDGEMMTVYTAPMTVYTAPMTRW